MSELVNRLDGLAHTGDTEGVRVNSIHPGFIATTPILEQSRNTPIWDGMTALTPMGQLGRPEDIAAGVPTSPAPTRAFIAGLELVNLQADERGLIVGPEARILESFAVHEPRAGGGFSGDNSSGCKSSGARRIQDLLAARGTAWLKEAVVSGDRPGSPTHSLVTSLGHHLGGYKFKPWEAVQ